VSGLWVEICMSSELGLVWYDIVDSWGCLLCLRVVSILCCVCMRRVVSVVLGVVGLGLGVMGLLE